MCKEKGTSGGSVVEPVMAKFAPFLKSDPSDSKYGLRKLVFKLSPINGIGMNTNSYIYQS